MIEKQVMDEWVDDIWIDRWHFDGQMMMDGETDDTLVDRLEMDRRVDYT